MQVVAVSRVVSTRLHRDYKFTAKVASLQYVSDSGPGIHRLKKGKGFCYRLTSGQTVKDKNVLTRIKKLVIPPAWTDVWISDKENGHIQATGFDLRQRKQYKYHVQWNEVRNQTKFHRLLEFGKYLPALRKRLEADLAGAALSKYKVLATIVSLMEKTFIRVGNSEYEKLYGSYGLTTLKTAMLKSTEVKLIFPLKARRVYTMPLR